MPNEASAGDIPVNVTINVDTAATSLDGFVTLDLQAGAAAHYSYGILYDPASITDRIPVTICITSQSSTNWTSFVVDWGGFNGSLPGVTSPSFTFINGDPLCQTKNIVINTGPLTLGPYASSANIQSGNTIQNEQALNGYKLKVLFDTTSTKTIHFNATVSPALDPLEIVSCFLTDSSGLLLTNCTGDAVSGQGLDVGKFAIVANRKGIEVATNPGQFYYNLIYNNTSPTDYKTVNVKITPITGAVAHGKQAMHWNVYNNYTTSLSQSEWDATNSTGNPDGADPNVYNVSVRPNSHLLVTYHLEWRGIGSQVPSGCASTCPLANQILEITGTVYDAGMNFIDDCIVKALGYKKSS
jgi:hypothetical protein